MIPAGWHVLRTFDGLRPTDTILAAIAAGRAGGATLFRARNVESPAQVRDLAERLQAARPDGDPPLVIGIDQEGGQLQAVGPGATAWPGNLALGAAGSAELAEAAGAAIGAEAAAMGATLVFAPVLDVVHPASATPVGTRAFSSDPAVVGRLGAAFVRGLQSAGVAATLKHFPGHGSARGDSHLAMPTVADPAEVIRARDLRPFVDGIAAGARAVLPGHIAAPALTGGRAVPATVSPELLDGILRRDLGFDGVTVSDALDMGGAGRPEDLEATAVAAVAAGIDLLLLVHPPEVEDRVVRAVHAAIESRAIPKAVAERSGRRISDLRRWLAEGRRPALDVVGSRAHEDLARRIAEASVTLVRDDSKLLPIGRGDGDRPRRVIVIAPNPVDLTPAETDSYLRLTLGDAFRGRGLDATELVAPLDPTDAQAAALAFAAGVGDGSDGERSLVIVGTWDAVSHPGQLRILDALAARGAPAVLAVALRSPYDVGAFPRSVAAACTYGIQPPQLEALAGAIVGEIPFRGRLPVALEASVGLEGLVGPEGSPDVERREPGREATGAPR